MGEKWYQKINYPVIAATLVLAALGFIILSSAGSRHGGSSEVNRQLTYFLIGLVPAIILAVIDYSLLNRLNYFIYGFTILILLAVIFFGKSALGAQRWLALGTFSFQPSELAKLSLIICLAGFISNRKDPASLSTFMLGLVLIGVPLALVLIQPDLGTSIILFIVLLTCFFLCGVKIYYLAGLLITCVIAAPAILKPYQWQRIFIFLNPESDPQAGGWNIIQSKIAIGSGQLYGKGLFSGTQSQLNFVPIHTKDFIFSVIGEELGFIGCTFLLFVFFVLIWETIKITSQTKDLFGMLIGGGIASMFIFHVFVNVGMAMGIMPVTGIPLPFISYGGTSLIVSMMAVGLLINLSLNCRKLRA